MKKDCSAGIDQIEGASLGILGSRKFLSSNVDPRTPLLNHCPPPDHATHTEQTSLVDLMGPGQPKTDTRAGLSSLEVEIGLWEMGSVGNVQRPTVI